MKNPYPILQLYGLEEISRECRLQVCFVFSSPDVLQASAAKVHDVCLVFALAGSYGAYQGIGMAGARSVLILESEFSEGNRITAVFFTSGIDYRAFQFLRNMLDWTPLHDMTLTSIDVMVAGRQRENVQLLPEIDDLNESEQYPSVSISPDIPSFVAESFDSSKSRRAVVDFFEPLSNAAFLTLKSYVDAWYSLLEKGAFSRPFGSAFEAECIRGVVSRFDVTSCEIHVSRYVVSEIGFRILANVLKSFSRHVARVAQLEID